MASSTDDTTSENSQPTDSGDDDDDGMINSPIISLTIKEEILEGIGDIKQEFSSSVTKPGENLEYSRNEDGDDTHGKPFRQNRNLRSDDDSGSELVYLPDSEDENWRQNKIKHEQKKKGKNSSFRSTSSDGEVSSDWDLDSNSEQDENWEKKRRRRKISTLSKSNKMQGKRTDDKYIANSNSYDRNKEIRCNLCPVTFKAFEKDNHYETIHDGFRVKCPVCDAKFVKRTEIHEHQISVHMSGEMFLCTICRKEFPTIRALSKHIRLHKMNSLCDKCGQVVPGGFESKMKKHRQIQCPVTRVKTFMCKLCDQGFYTRYQLQTHELKHSGERPYKCPDCGKGFFQKKTLDNHRRVHSGERPFKCEICGKGFRQDGPLLYHMSTHTGKKKVSCGVCGKWFLYASHMKQHKCVKSKEGESSNEYAPSTKKKSRGRPKAIMSNKKSKKLKQEGEISIDDDVSNERMHFLDSEGDHSVCRVHVV